MFVLKDRLGRSTWVRLRCHLSFFSNIQETIHTLTDIKQTNQTNKPKPKQNREIRDCRALQPHALRVYGAELAPPGVPSAAAATPNPPTGPSGIHAAAAAHAQGQGEEGEGGAGAVGAPVLRLYGFSKPRCVCVEGGAFVCVDGRGWGFGGR